MSYTALYRKWRPKDFDDVVGQDAIARTLKNQIISGRIAHAYLFCGTRGTGKTSMAKIMARAVNCQNPQNGNPCNQCENCLEILKDASINVVEMDAASYNGVDNVRETKERLNYPPTSGKYKVFIIDEVHMLSTGAFNALLKTLEEPPDYAIFILATTEVHKIPVTILSRCQRFDLKRIGLKVIAAQLYKVCKEENINIDEKSMDYIARCSDGALRDALSLLEECRAYYPNEAIVYEKVLDILGTVDMAVFDNMCRKIIENNTVELLMLLDEVCMQGRDLSQFVTDMLWYFRNLLLLKVSKDVEGIIDVSSDNIEIMRYTSGLLNKESLNRYIRIFSELLNNLRNSVSKRVLIEIALIKICTPVMDSNTDSLYERISKLEVKLENVGKIDFSSPISRQLPLVDEVKEQSKKAEKVELSVSSYEDYKLVKKDWYKILDDISTINSVKLKNTYIEAKENTINIVFNEKTLYNLCDKEGLIEELKSYALKVYKKELNFDIICVESKDRIEKEYVTKEELSEIIKYDIDIEE